MSQVPVVGSPCVITPAALQALLERLADDGYQTVGPVVRDQAIVYEPLRMLAELPVGWTDRQEAGHYRLIARDDPALFGFTVGPHSWKKFLYPPSETLWTALARDGLLSIELPKAQTPKYALLGVRACELQAIAIQDRVFCEGPYVDEGYAARRGAAFIIAVNCGKAGGTCFCVSMDSGPKASTGFDLALTELRDATQHLFVVEVGSVAGAAYLAQIDHVAATSAQSHEAERIVQHTAAQMGRRLDTDGLKELLQQHPEHPRWDAVAERCLSCGNCTLVCPTCFCSTVDDHSSLDGASAERVRSWDSCFTMDFSYIHGGSVRSSTKSRYRQWMTHKLSAWIDQFGTSGCVGCGRCISWCPVGIDLTEEAAGLRASLKPSQGSVL